VATVTGRDVVYVLDAPTSLTRHPAKEQPDSAATAVSLTISTFIRRSSSERMHFGGRNGLLTSERNVLLGKLMLRYSEMSKNKKIILHHIKPRPSAFTSLFDFFIYFIPQLTLRYNQGACSIFLFLNLDINLNYLIIPFCCCRGGGSSSRGGDSSSCMDNVTPVSIQPHSTTPTPPRAGFLLIICI
jgi:hypothetical protein